MTYLLIALYLLEGSTDPQMRTSLHTDKSSCQAAQTKYMKSQAVGSKWAICKKLNPKKEEI